MDAITSLDSFLQYLLSLSRRERNEKNQLQEEHQRLQSRFDQLESYYSVLNTQQEEQKSCNTLILRRLEGLENK